MGDIDQFFQDSHYNIIRVLLSVSGLWPFHSRIRRYGIYLTMLLVLGSGCVFETLGVIEASQDSSELIDAVPMYFVCIVSIIKTFCAIYTLPQIKILLIKMQEYCISPISDEERKIQNSHAQYGRKLGYAYAGFVLGHSIVYLIATFLVRLFYGQPSGTDGLSKRLPNSQIPHHVNYMIDHNKYYYPIFLHAAICDASYTFLITTFDVLYITSVEYCCGLFATLRYRLEIAFDKNNDFGNDKTAMTKDTCYSNIVYSIRRHTEAIQFVAILESVYSISLFIQLGAIMISISFLGYQVINYTENANRLIKPVLFLNTVFFNAFFENWQGQKVIDSSERVFESVYNTEWYSMPIAARKLLLIMIMRSEKPSIIKMGKMVNLSYVTFNAVLRTSSSYFMLLRSL
ncbi:PREDICTED: odorant receptor Or2-like [Wasmannia auropunctata]|uniref:odorant receptor Or2-like n=1 Tax=Wasmannia auropunctata TaxID=64793 RepID=UPI0005EEC0BA|nr:PREDICTED: odorant receptor Or2-like [Wasmannia auropunctata]